MLTMYEPKALPGMTAKTATQNAVRPDSRVTWTDGEYIVTRTDGRPHVALLDPPALARSAA